MNIFEIISIILVALLLVCMMFYYIYQKDRKSPEPTRLLIKAFILGVLSVLLSFCLSIPFEWIGLYSIKYQTLLGGIGAAFWGAAIPKEVAKLFVLWLLLRRNPYFDEKVDGIVYAVCVSLGFASLENVVYLFLNCEAFIFVGITRALFAIPGHFCFGILMGYYYSLVKFYPKAPLKNKILVIVAPVVAHGLYDSILFTINVTPAVSIVLVILFLILCHRMWKLGNKKISEHLDRDFNETQ